MCSGGMNPSASPGITRLRASAAGAPRNTPSSRVPPPRAATPPSRTDVPRRDLCAPWPGRMSCPLPLTRASCILILQFDVWWKIHGLASLEQWTIGAFMLLAPISFERCAGGGPIPPFAAGECSKDSDQYLREDGRWAVALVAGLFMPGSVANPVLFGMPVFGPVDQFDAAGIGLLGITVKGRKRETRAPSLPSAGGPRAPACSAGRGTPPRARPGADSARRRGGRRRPE